MEEAIEAAYRAWAEENEGLLADGYGRVIQSQAGRKAFYAGWEAREKAPNTLIIDTTNAQMVEVPNTSAAAGGVPITLRNQGRLKPFVVFDPDTD